jgi:hypothetical protein
MASRARYEQDERSPQTSQAQKRAMLVLSTCNFGEEIKQIESTEHAVVQTASEIHQ